MNSLFTRENQLFADAQSGKRLTPPWLAPILAVAFVLLGSLPVLVVLSIVVFVAIQSAQSIDQDQLMAQLYGTPLSLTLILVGSFAPVALLIWLWARLFEGRTLRTLGLSPAGALARAFRGGALGLLSFAAVVVLLLITGSAQTTLSAGLGNLGGALLGSLLLLAGFSIQGPTEELVFRGWLLPVFGARTNPAWGVLISSTLFGLVHSLNPGVSVLAIANIVLVGVFLALYALHERSIWGVCGWHAVWNWSQGSVFGFEVSGTPVPHALLDSRGTGPDWLSGGEFGPEAGIVTTLVLLVSIGILVVHARRTANQ